MLQKLSGRDADLLLARLDKAIGPAYQSWETAQAQVALIGAFGALINPPRDRTSYLLDGELPVALARADQSLNPVVKELRALARQLDTDAYIWLLLAYADSKGDQEGVRRAWDVATNPNSPYRQMFNRFRERSDGGKMRSGTTQARNATIVAAARELKAEGKQPRSIAGRLARKYGRTPRRIRQIIKES